MVTSSDNLVLRLAHDRVHEYADDAVLRQHQEAMKCRDCEEFLQVGIDSFRILRMAEEFLRDADYRGLFRLTSEARDALDAMYVAWLGPCEDAERWISNLQAHGYTPDHVDVFRVTCDEAREFLGRREWQQRATRARLLSQSEEPW